MQTATHTIRNQTFERGSDGRLSGGVVHRQSHTPEYRAWKNMIQRCENPKATGFSEYGGRGIAVHPEWRNSFEKFVADVGPRPTPAHTLDRLRVNENYGPGNCAWKTQAQQNRNQRKNIFVTIDGVKMALVDAVEKVGGVKYNTVVYRIRRGKTPEEALGLVSVS